MNKKKFLYLFLTLALTLFLTQGTLYAYEKVDDPSPLSISYNENGEKILIDTSQNIHYIKAYTADGTEISLEEYKSLLDSSNKSEQLLSAPLFTEKNHSVSPLSTGVIDMSYYSETLKWSEHMPPRVATPTTDCRNSSADCPINISQSFTDSQSFSAGLSSKDMQYIQANASFTWTKSSTSVYSTTLSVPKGKRGYLTWSPKYNFSKGDITYAGVYPYIGYQVISVTKDVWGASPAQTVLNFTDGIWAIAIVN